MKRYLERLNTNALAVVTDAINSKIDKFGNKPKTVLDVLKIYNLLPSELDALKSYVNDCDVDQRNKNTIIQSIETLL